MARLLSIITLIVYILLSNIAIVGFSLGVSQALSSFEVFKVAVILLSLLNMTLIGAFTLMYNGIEELTEFYREKITKE